MRLECNTGLDCVHRMAGYPVLHKDDDEADLPADGEDCPASFGGVPRADQSTYALRFVVSGDGQVSADFPISRRAHTTDIK